MTYISNTLRRRVWERAGGCCEYCHLGHEDTFLPHEVDHIIAEKHRGKTDEDNLCLSCYDCNRFKGSDIASVDPETDKVVPLYHPRRDVWREHFRQNGPWIEPLTAEGRVTVELLHINDPEQIEKREALLEMGRYPCRLP